MDAVSTTARDVFAGLSSKNTLAVVSAAARPQRLMRQLGQSVLRQPKRGGHGNSQSTRSPLVSTSLIGY